MKGYGLSESAVKALSAAISLKPALTLITKIYLENNGLTDSGMAVFLTGMSRLKRVESLTLKFNEFGLQSLSKIQPILSRIADSLHTLRLIRCKTSSRVISELLEQLKTQGMVQKLSIVDSGLCETGIVKLGQLLKETTKIKQLDISWSALRPNEYFHLFQALKENRTLT